VRLAAAAGMDHHVRRDGTNILEKRTLVPIRS